MIPKFRAWEPYKNKMNYKVMVGNCDADDDNWTCPIIWDKDRAEWVHFDHTDYIMQSTGIFDKNGVEIFEGDVVANPENPELKFEIRLDVLAGIYYKVSNGDTEYLAASSEEEIEGAREDSKKYLEVIGNIYENTELVEVTE